MISTPDGASVRAARSTAVLEDVERRLPQNGKDSHAPRKAWTESSCNFSLDRPVLCIPTERSIVCLEFSHWFWLKVTIRKLVSLA
jgi:hypothetical protein